MGFVSQFVCCCRPSVKIFAFLAFLILILNGYFLLFFDFRRCFFGSLVKVAPSYQRHPSTAHLQCDTYYKSDEASRASRWKERQKRITLQDHESLQTDCESIRSRGYYPDQPLSTMEAEFPLAYARIVFRDYLYLETMFRLEYAPQNVFCYTIDSKANPLFKTRIRNLQKCFPDNVFIAKNEYDVSSSGYNLSSANWACVEEIKHKKWEYVFLLQNFDVKIKTNAEMVRILKAYDGANDISALIPKSSLYTHKFDWSFQSLNLFKDPAKNKDSHGRKIKLKIVKTLSEVTLSRQAADYIMENMDLTTYIHVLERGSYAMDEFFLSSLNANEAVGLPGGFTTSCLDQKKEVGGHTRYTIWRYTPDLCYSKRWRHIICIFGIEDLDAVYSTKYFFANKIMADFDFGAVDCMMEKVHNKTYFEDDENSVDLEYYRNLAHVRYNRLKKAGNLSQFQC